MSTSRFTLPIITLSAAALFALLYLPAFAATQKVCVKETDPNAPDPNKAVVERCYEINIIDPGTTPGPEPSGPPQAPRVGAVNGSTVSGTAEPNSSINAFSTSTGLSCAGKASATGEFSCSLNGTPGAGELIYVTASNSKGTSPVGRIQAPGGAGESRGFLREGLFGCQAGQYGMAVGTLQAIGGVYVPVNDAAVTLNTGYLVYKECVLDGVIVKMREAAAAAIVKSILNAANRGRGGGPEYPVSWPKELQDQADAILVDFLKTYNLKNICAPFQNQVKVAIAKEYMRQTRDPNDAFRCELGLPPNELRSFLGGNTAVGGEGGLWDLFSNTSNSPWGAASNAMLEAYRREYTRKYDVFTQLGWNNGIFSREDRVSVPTDTGETYYEYRTLTPGYIVAQILGQAVSSGYRQLENADEIDQIINALFSGITNQIMTDIRGLTGVSEVRLGKAPYLDQLSAEASAGLRESASNAALAVLNSSIAVEQEYNARKRESVSLLQEAASQLKRAEEQCWVKVVDAVRQLAAAQGVQINVSTSSPVITGGTVALRLPGGAALSAQQFSFAAPPSTIIESGTFTFSATAATTSATEQALGFTISGISPAPAPGGNATFTTASVPSFSPGTLVIKLRSGQQLPLGDVRFALSVVAPFSQGAVSLIVDVARQFADKAIAEQIDPILLRAQDDLRASNEAMRLLAQLANDLRNTASLTAQRIALERIDSMIANRILHTAFDLKDAQEQVASVKTAVATLIESTVRAWTEGSAWCNINNPDVVRQWFERWKI